MGNKQTEILAQNIQNSINKIANSYTTARISGQFSQVAGIKAEKAIIIAFSPNYGY